MSDTLQGTGVRSNRIQKFLSAFFQKNKTTNLKPASRGFTLVEMIVAVALFAVVMLISVSTLLALIDANRKARTLQSVVNNLNVALDGMVRSLRMGHTYRCGGGNPAEGDVSCPDGDDVLSFIDRDGVVVTYQWDSTWKRLQISRNGGAFAYLTAPEIEITELKMYVVGTTPGDALQPKVVMVIRGVANANNNKTKSNFSMQSTAVQRTLDI
jgi:prepilin-type N-terminal cleavage/methylation domain-containing protein